MTDQWNTGPSGSGERWNVNLPAVVGVVFVFLVGVVIWVIATSDGDDELAIDGSSPDSSVPFTTPAPSSTLAMATVPIITSPVPLPVTTPAPAPLTVPVTIPPTAAPVAPPAPQPPAPPATQPPVVQPPATTTTVPGPTTSFVPTPAPGGGDLGVPGHTIQKPPCDGSAITIIASAIGDEATPESMGEVLDQYTGSHYLRTDQTCPSLTQSQNGEPVFVVYFGPFPQVADACAARSDGPGDAYVRKLSTDLPPGHGVSCS